MRRVQLVVIMVMVELKAGKVATADMVLLEVVMEDQTDEDVASDTCMLDMSACKLNCNTLGSGIRY